MVETEVGVVLTKDTTVVGAMMAGLMVMLVVFTTIFTTCLVTSLTNMSSPAVMLMAGPAGIDHGGDDGDGGVLVQSLVDGRKCTKHADFH